MLLTAHSGSDWTPENSRLYLETMLEIEVDCVEVDVRKQANTMYLSHDPVAELDNILTLEEAFLLLTQYDKGIINCDLKEPNLEKEVISMAKAYDLEDRLLLSGTVQVERLEDTFKENSLLFNPENSFPNFYNDLPLQQNKVNALINYCKHHAISTINVNYHILTEDLMKQLADEGIQLSIWTVDDFDSIDYYKSQGVYNVTTKQALAYLKSRRVSSD